MVRHIVFIKIKDDNDKQVNLEQIKQKLVSLNNNMSGIVSSEIGFNFSTSDYDLILDAVFKDPFSLKQYQNHPDNVNLDKFIEPILVDRVVCDYMISKQDSLSFTKNIPSINLSKTGPIPQSFNNANNSNDKSNTSNNSDTNNTANSNNNDVNDDNNNVANNTCNNQSKDNNRFNGSIGSLNQSLMNPKRDTLAVSPNNLSDDAFALPYERNFNNNKDSFNNSSRNDYNDSMNNMNNRHGSDDSMRNMNNKHDNSSNGQDYMDNKSYSSMNNNYNNDSNNRSYGSMNNSYNNDSNNRSYDSMNNNYNNDSNNKSYGSMNNNYNNDSNSKSYDSMNNNYNNNSNNKSYDSVNNSYNNDSNNKSYGSMNNNYNNDSNNKSYGSMNNNYNNDYNNDSNNKSYGSMNNNYNNDSNNKSYDSMNNNYNNDSNNKSYGSMNNNYNNDSNNKSYGSMNNNYNNDSNNKSYGSMNNNYNNDSNNSYGFMNNNYNNDSSNKVDSYNEYNASNVDAQSNNSSYLAYSPEVISPYDSNSSQNCYNKPSRRMDSSSNYNNSVESPWKCPQCGKQNSSYVSTCNCGFRKPPMRHGQMAQSNNSDYNSRQSSGKAMPSLSLPGPEAPSNAASSIFETPNSMLQMENNASADGAVNAWVCNSCGTVNGDFVGQCSCGQLKPSRGDMAYSNAYNQQANQTNGRKSYGRQRNSNKSSTSAFRSVADTFSYFKHKDTSAYNNNTNMNNNASMNNYSYMQSNGYGQQDPYSQMAVSNQQSRYSGGRQGNNGWKCPRCGKIHGSFVGQCGCGQRRPSRNMNY